MTAYAVVASWGSYEDSSSKVLAVSLDRETAEAYVGELERDDTLVLENLDVLREFLAGRDGRHPQPPRPAYRPVPVLSKEERRDREKVAARAAVIRQNQDEHVKYAALYDEWLRAREADLSAFARSLGIKQHLEPYQLLSNYPLGDGLSYEIEEVKLI